VTPESLQYSGALWCSLVSHAPESDTRLNSPILCWVSINLNAISVVTRNPLACAMVALRAGKCGEGIHNHHVYSLADHCTPIIPAHRLHLLSVMTCRAHKKLNPADERANEMTVVMFHNQCIASRPQQHIETKQHQPDFSPPDPASPPLFL
jgi:hypothetical protein